MQQWVFVEGIFWHNCVCSHEADAIDDEVVYEANRVGALATYLSGAGPTIMALVEKAENGFAQKMIAFLKEKSLNFAVCELSIDNIGAVVIDGEE